MESTTSVKPWQEEFIEVYDDIPESEGFDEVTADKQLEGLLNIVTILGETLTRLEKQNQQLAEKLIQLTDGELADDVYESPQLSEYSSNIYM